MGTPGSQNRSLSPGGLPPEETLPAKAMKTPPLALCAFRGKSPSANSGEGHAERAAHPSSAEAGLEQRGGCTLEG